MLHRDADGNSIDPAEDLEDWLSETSAPAALGTTDREAAIAAMSSM